MEPVPIGTSFYLEVQSISGAAYGFPSGSTLRWVSSDPKIATVTGTGSPGRVHAVGKGTATITCEMFINGTVNNVPIGTIVLKESVTVTQPDLFKLVASGFSNYVPV